MKSYTGYHEERRRAGGFSFCAERVEPQSILRTIRFQKEKSVDEGNGKASSIRLVGRYCRDRKVLVCGFEW